MSVRRIALIAFSAALTAQDQKPEILSLECRGEEPFWSLRANATNATLSRPGATRVEELLFRGGLQSLPGQPPWVVWRGASSKTPSLSLALVARQEVCRSTMADESESPAMDHRAILSLKAGEAAMGCCRAVVGLNPTKAPIADFKNKALADWSASLPTLLPAVQLCVLEAGTKADRVMKAWPVNPGKAGMRLISRDHQETDCVADLTGKGQVTLSKGTSAPPGAGHPVFYPAREQPPILQCGRLERVVTGTGTTAGYLHYPCQPATQCDPGLIDLDRSLLQEFEATRQLYEQKKITKPEFLAKLTTMQQQESAILMRASAQRCDDLTLHNYWRRGRLKFPSPISETRKRLSAEP